MGGQCWYVLGCDGKGRPIGSPEEIPDECGVMVRDDERLEVVRNAPKRAIADLPFSMWMALAKGRPVGTDASSSGVETCQAVLTEYAYQRPLP